MLLERLVSGTVYDLGGVKIALGGYQGDSSPGNGWSVVRDESANVA
jgi:hypothetical protein